MKITRIDVIELPPVQGMHLVFARVHAGDVYGIGETGVAIGAGGKGAAEIMKDIAPMLIGMDPIESEVIWDKMFRQTFWGIGGGAFIMSALAAIDTAVWDLKGKLLGQSVAKLLGGRQHDKLRAYASQLQMGWKVSEHSAFESPEQLSEACRRAVTEGYTAVKANVIGLDESGRRRPPLDTIGLMDKSILKRAEQRLAAMRETLGPDKDIILENHAITDANTSVQFAQIAGEYDILFYEEPAIPTNAAVFERISKNCSIPLATGERTYGRAGFLPLISGGAISVIQPDIGNCGGVTEVKKIADMAALYDVAVQAHVCSSPVSVAVSLQVESALTNFAIHEHHLSNTLMQVRDLCVNDYQPVNGYFDVPDLPGIGQDLAKAALESAQIETIR